MAVNLRNTNNDLMKTILTFIFLIPLVIGNLFCQTRTITGRIISEDLEPIPAVSIQYINTTLIGRTDLEGRFKIEVPSLTDSLLFSFIGMECTVIKLSGDCNTLEIVMMVETIYDFITLKKVDRLRMKRFKKLPEIHQQAFDQGLFITENLCYEQAFEYYHDK